MINFNIELPSSLKLKEFDVKMIIASKLFESGKLSSGQASEIVGISKRAFLEILGKYNVSIFGYEYSDIEEDLSNA